MMNYTVCFLICRETGCVLLLKKDRTDFVGRYNGVGGKIEANEMPYSGAVREIREETGVDTAGRLYWLGTLMLPDDCGKHDPEGCTLHFYTADVGEDEVSQQVGESEQLAWFPVRVVISSAPTCENFAGRGDVQYFVNLAWNHVCAKPQ